MRKNEPLPCHTPAGCKYPVLLYGNEEAWEIYTQYLNNRFIADYPGAFLMIFEIMGLKKSRMEALELIQKLILIHAIVTEPKEKSRK